VGNEVLRKDVELLERAQQWLGQLERELAEQREEARSLTETLLAAARAGEAIKHDAREEAEAIRAEGRALQEFVATRGAQFAAFLLETLEKLETLSVETMVGDRVVSGEEEPPHAPASSLELTPAAEPSPDGGGEGDGSILERLRPYGASPTAPHSPDS
jgi:hypothetical protein